WSTYSAFDGCTNLKTVTYLGTLAQWCALNGGGYLISVVDASQVTMSDGTDLKTMTNLVIPNGVERIGYYAFYKRENLTSVTIPASVTGIGRDAFSNCTSLAEVTYLGTEEQWNAIEGIDKSGLSGKTITFAP
ncbi:MAG: leucine-rich repeat domain-containing protein, partial [Treponemataceae bacterium]|nr:leucine-rich repeat domain-containing protein [Treponemataceae bacterium]